MIFPIIVFLNCLIGQMVSRIISFYVYIFCVSNFDRFLFIDKIRIYNWHYWQCLSDLSRNIRYSVYNCKINNFILQKTLRNKNFTFFYQNTHQTNLTMLFNYIFFPFIILLTKEIRHFRYCFRKWQEHFFFSSLYVHIANRDWNIHTTSCYHHILLEGRFRIVCFHKKENICLQKNKYTLFCFKIRMSEYPMIKEIVYLQMTTAYCLQVLHSVKNTQVR